MNSLLRYLIFFSLLCPIFSTSQEDDIQFEHLSMKDGLSMNPVMSILQDHSGFLWFGTQDGLNKFDGYKITVFKTKDSDSLSISDNFITSMSLDKEGNIWIGTLNGLNLYNSTGRNFTRFPYHDKISNTQKIYCTYIDKKGFLWLGTSSGISLFDTKEKKFLKIKEVFKGLSSMDQRSVLSILQDSKGVYWFGTSSGLVKYSAGKEELRTYYAEKNYKNSISNNIVISLYEDKAGTLWVGTLDGLCSYEPKTDIFWPPVYFKNGTGTGNEKNVEMNNVYSIVNNYGGNTIRCMLEDEKGQLWIGTDMELIIYNPKTGKYVNYKKDLINPTGINDHFIRSMFVDNSKNLWIGTLGNGLNKTNLKPKKFRHYQKKINNDLSLSENYVRSICEDNKKNIWIATLVGGLNRFDRSSGNFYRYQKKENLSPNSINDNNLWSVCFDENRNGLWIGTNNGLDFLDFNTNKFSHFLHDANNPSSISDNTIRYIFIDKKGNVWFGTENGLNIFIDETKSFQSFTLSNSKISGLSVWCIKEGPEGKIWFATNNGLNCLDPLKKEITVYKKQENDINSLSHNGLRTLIFDKDGELWIGSQNGLNRLNLSTMKFTRYYEEDGLPNSFIYGIVEDNSGKLWISSNKGISAFDKKTNTFKNYDVYDGLQDYEFNTNACFKSTGGELFFGGPGGLNIFDPNALPVNSFIPQIVLTDVKVKGNSVDPAKLKDNLLELDYCENILFFEFSALDYTSPPRNRYMYKLEGFNDDWVDAGNVRFCTYTNLDPGKYTLLVKGSNVDGIWSDQTVRLNIDIKPPFWKTIWFYALEVVAVILAIFVYIKWRTRSLLRSKELLEQKVKERTFVIEAQKTELASKNKDITDSINYAQRIQNALLPNEEYFANSFQESFVLYMPRDIVSGDMYWFKEVTTSTADQLKLKVVAVIDCTGHGVPGAFMSLIVSELLNQTIKNPDINSPADLLGFLATALPRALNQNSNKRINDGLDIAVCAIDTKNNKVYYSGANRPLWIIRARSYELEEIKATKFSIGGNLQDFKGFTNHSISLAKGDMIYMCTDGFADQFGGETGKKLGSGNFKKLLKKLSHLPMTEQKKELKIFFAGWKGDNEQVDDICIIGIKI